MKKDERRWAHESKYHWRCAPWSICLCFVDGCSLYVLSKDGNPEPIAHKDELKDVMQIAKEMEA
jgi:hypothetical protein